MYNRDILLLVPALIISYYRPELVMVKTTIHELVHGR